ncbi:hypothetical protein F4825DRAFT_473076 [Nemania diffusa]|nr:hypothetical protein F4825DRAFT_473076 [Nemania diffusa]
MMSGAIRKTRRFCKSGSGLRLYSGGETGDQTSNNTGAAPYQSSQRVPNPCFEIISRPSYPPPYYERERPGPALPAPPQLQRSQILSPTPAPADEKLRNDWVIINQPTITWNHQEIFPASLASTRYPSESKTSLALFQDSTTNRLDRPNFGPDPCTTSRPGGSDTSSSSSTQRKSLQRSHGIPSISSSSSSPSEMRNQESLNKMDSSSDFNSFRLDAEARSIVARLRKDEIKTEMLIDKFNAQVEAMICQGREALSANFKAEESDNEGEWVMSTSCCTTSSITNFLI